MRIISQDGYYDIPYESIILRRLGTSIFGVTTGLQESITIARYRKEEKAEKAMEMCRKNMHIANLAEACYAEWKRKSE